MSRVTTRRRTVRSRRDPREHHVVAALGERDADIGSAFADLVGSLHLDGWGSAEARAVMRAIVANAPAAEVERLTSTARRICADREAASRAAAADPSRGKLIDFQEALRELLAERAGKR